MPRAHRLLPPLLTLLTSACATLCPDLAALDAETTMIALGDSILATNARTCESIPHQAALSLGRGVDHRAVSGRSVSKGSDPIPAQYEPGPWDWAIVDGGANDIVSVCGTPAFSDVVDGLASADGTSGDMVDLIDRILADGARVVLTGYYPMQANARYGFEDCAGDLVALNARYAAFAETRAEVEFVDLGEVIGPDRTPEAYLPDRVHPNPQGSALGGELVAQRIGEVEADD